MKPQLREQVAGLERRRQELLAELGALTDAQLTFQPVPGAWSIQQVIEHLLLVEGGIVERIVTRPARAGRRRLRDRLGYAAVWVALSYGLRVKSPVRSVMPEKGVTIPDAAERWRTMHGSLSAHLAGLRDGDAAMSVYKHPIGGPMTLNEAMLFITRHFDHHLKQIARIRNTAAYPRGKGVDQATLVSPLDRI